MSDETPKPSSEVDPDRLEMALELAWETLEEEHLALGRVRRDDPYSLERLADLYQAACGYVEVLERMRAVYGQPGN